MGRGLAHGAGTSVVRCARRVATAARRALGCFGCCSAQLDDSMEAATTAALLRREARRPARRRSAVPARRCRSYGASPGTSPRAASNVFDALASEDWATPPLSTRAAGGPAPLTPPPEPGARLERLAAMFPQRDHAPAAYF